MATLKLSHFFLSIIFLVGTTTITITTATKSPSSNFITSSCTTTTYPSLCVHSLSPYAKSIKHNPTQLTRVALSVTLNRSESAQSYIQKLTGSKVLNPRELSAVRDCLEEVNDSVDRVRNSIRELKNVDRVKGQEFFMHMSNVQTWVSSALTDESTCVDGFSGREMEGRVQKLVRAQITDVAHVTSNALALINHFVVKHS